MTITEKELLANCIRREIAYAETQVRPSSTGHIHTAINWMKSRLTTVEEQLENAYRSEHLNAQNDNT
jgi:hypothetical protein